MLSGLVGKSQNTQPIKYSVPKQYAIQLLDKFDKLASKHTQQSWTKRIWTALKYWVKTSVIPSKTDEEIREDLLEIYKVLRPFFEEVQVAEQLKNPITEKVVNEKVKLLPRYKELSKLL